MSKPKPRTLFFSFNKYQLVIFLSMSIPFVFFLIVSLLFIEYFSQWQLKVVLTKSDMSFIDSIYHMRFYITIIFWGVIVSTMLFFFSLSKMIVGAHSRILRELDEVIAGTRQGKIDVRPKDKFFQELLSRINILIEAYQRKKTNE